MFFGFCGQYLSDFARENSSKTVFCRKKIQRRAEFPVGKVDFGKDDRLQNRFSKRRLKFSANDDVEIAEFHVLRENGFLARRLRAVSRHQIGAESKIVAGMGRRFETARPEALAKARAI
jgi:hypothetical protein